jgi:hypothetical protein
LAAAGVVSVNSRVVGNSEVTISSIELRVETEKVSIKERGHFPFDFCESGQASVPSQFTP